MNLYHIIFELKISMLFFLNVHKNSFLRIMNNTITSDFEEVSINLQKEYEEEKEIDQVQIKLSSKIFKIPKINLFKFSVCLRDNCDYKTVGEFFSRKIQLYTERFKIKESSMILEFIYFIILHFSIVFMELNFNI